MSNPKDTHMVTLFHKGKPVKMWPVDARYALSLGGEYSTHPTKVEEVAPVQPQVTESPAMLQGVIEDPDAVTMDQLRDALCAAGESFRGNASKADLITQWNALASTNA